MRFISLMKFLSFAFVRHGRWAVVCLAILCSCQMETASHLTPDQIQSRADQVAKENTQIVTAAQEILDITAGALTIQGVKNARLSSYEMTRTSALDCGPSIISSYHVNRNRPDSILYAGTLAIDYENGSGCNPTDRRKGKITDTFTFARHILDSLSYRFTETITLQGFQKDSVQVEGTFIVQSSSSALTTWQMKNAKLTYPDGTFTKWNGILTSIFLEGTSTWTGYGDTKEISGSMGGTSREGYSFITSIDKALVIKYSCSRKIPVSGSLDINTDSISSLIDYGQGICDKTYTISAGGKTSAYAYSGEPFHQKLR